jgi:hypothetical protein
MSTFWRSPQGRIFGDPTEAMCDALVRCARVRHEWCPRPGDLAMHARISMEWYVTSPRVRRRVEAILASAGYVECEVERVLVIDPLNVS